MTDFRTEILALTDKIPRGKITTYKILAQKVGSPGASRACGNALNRNEKIIKTPCHRVVRSDGSIGGYVNGQKEKIKLLEKEGVRITNGKVVDFEKKLWS